MSRQQIKEALDQIPLETIISGEGKKRRLTSKQQGFVKDVAMGLPKAEAYRRNYNTKSKKQYQGNEAFKLASNPKISNEIEAFKVALLAREYQKGEQLKAFIMHQLTQHALNEDNPPASRIRSLELLGKSYEVGLFVERKEVTTINNSSDIKAKLIEQLKDAMNRNKITIDNDAYGDSLLQELQATPIESSGSDTHEGCTPLFSPSDHEMDLHTIPHKRSHTNENDSQTAQTSYSQDVDYIEENDATVYEHSHRGGGIERSEGEEEDDLGNTPLSDLKQKG